LHIRREVGQEVVDIDKLVRLLDPFDMPVVSFGIVIVVQHGWGLLASPNECQTIADASGSAVLSRYIPDHERGDIPFLVDDLLTQNKPRPPHRPRPICGMIHHISSHAVRGLLDGRSSKASKNVAALIAALVRSSPSRAVTLYETFLAGCYEKAEELDDSSGSFGSFVGSLFCGWATGDQDPARLGRRRHA